MIDLNRNRAQMLAEIEAAEDVRGRLLVDPGDPALLSREGVCLRLRGHTRDELLPALESVLERRFGGVPKKRLNADLLDLLKKGLGNAYKRGNGKNIEKWIRVEVTATRRGALVSIADEGSGFDVEAVVGRLRRNERYFENAGSGMSRLEKSRSLVSWEEGGRTLLICFRFHPEPGRLATGIARTDLGAMGDEEAMKSRFAAEVPYFRKNRLRLESCRVYVPVREHSQVPEVRYVVECRKTSAKKKSVSMTARLLPHAAAQTDFRVAQELYRGEFQETTGVRIPKPLAVLEEPSLVLYRFQPAQTLRELAKRITRFRDLAKEIRKVAAALSALHLSVLPVALEEGPEAEVEHHRSARARIEARVAGGGRPERVGACVDRLGARAATLATWERVPIHGAFGWDSVVYDDGGRPYLYRFDRCRRSHPGLDLGGFVADLLRFYVVRDKGNPEFYSEGRDLFLDTYFGPRVPPWRRDMDFFVACGLLRRLDRLFVRREGRWEPKMDAILDQLERALA